MKKVLVNYNFTPDPEWIGDDYLIYDRSDDGIDHLEAFDPAKIIKTPNFGQVDFDKLTYLVENYDTLPAVFLWGKTNLFKYITPDEYEKVKNNKTFTPLLTQNHKTYSDKYGVVNFYRDGWYYERNDDWFFGQFSTKYAGSFREWCYRFGLPQVDYTPFAPGGSYVLTREVVHKYPVEFYNNMRSTLPYCAEPAEAQCAERSYGLMWGNIVVG